MDDQTKERINKLRSATLGSPAVSARAIVHWAGEEFEVRRPTLKQSREIQERSKRKDGSQDELSAMVNGIVACTYAPGTNERVFSMADADAIMDRGPDDFIGALAKGLAELVANPEGVEKNSDSAPTE